MGRCKQFGVTHKGWYRGGNQVVGQCKKDAIKDGYCWHHHPENKKPKLDLKSQIRQLKAQAKADTQRMAELEKALLYVLAEYVEIPEEILFGKNADAEAIAWLVARSVSDEEAMREKNTERNRIMKESA